MKLLGIKLSTVKREEEEEKKWEYLSIQVGRHHRIYV